MHDFHAPKGMVLAWVQLHSQKFEKRFIDAHILNPEL